MKLSGSKFCVSSPREFTRVPPTTLSKWSNLESKKHPKISLLFREQIADNTRRINNYTKSLKDIYAQVSENLLLAKCKLIKSNVREVEELLKESEFYLSEMKISIP
jgi:hypothetical protein